MHALTGERMGGHRPDLLPWSPGEPNGERVENCVEEYRLLVGWSWYINDVDCREKHWFFFRFPTARRFNMRGREKMSLVSIFCVIILT